MNSAARLVLLAPLALLAACSSYRAPVLTVAETRVREAAPSGVVVEFLIDAENPNPEPMPLREVRYAMQVNGQRVFECVRSPEATLRRFGTQRLILPVVLPLAPGATPPSASDVTLSGTLSYTAPGQLAETLFDTGVSRPEASFTTSAPVDFTRAPVAN